MLKIGLISAASYGYQGAVRTPGSNHGTAFATAFNGWREDRVARYSNNFVRSRRKIPGVEVLKVWDPHQEAAQKFAEACSIPTVCGTPEEACDGMDAVLLIDDGSGEQGQYAKYPLQKGIATFCDKPLSMSAKRAQDLVKLARSTGARFMSSSALRFVPEIVKLRDDLPKIGPVYLATVACGNDLIYYGVHALAMAYSVLGAGAISAVNVGQLGLNQVRVRFGDHRDVIVLVGEKQWMSVGYQISLYGQKAWRTLSPDLTDLYTPLLEAFVGYVETGKEPFPIEQEVEMLAALEAGKRSLTTGREITVQEVLKG
jgi:predicted dehydrogenase